MEHRALLVGYGGSHIQIIHALADCLGRRRIDHTILALTTGGVYLDSLGYPFLSYRDFVTPEDERAHAHGTRLAASMHTPETGIPLEESVAYLGLSFADMEDRVGEAEAQRLFAEQGRHAFLQTGVLRRVFDKVDPTLVITTNSPKSERAAVRVARERGIPSLAVEALFGFQTLGQLEGDRICVLCDLAAENLVDGGVPRESIRVTGVPIFDRLVAERGPLDLEYRANHVGTFQNRRAVLWIDQSAYWLTSENRRHVKDEAEIQSDLDTLLAACEQVDADLMIRPHPSQSHQTFLDWLEGKDRVHFVPSTPLHRLIRSSDLIVTRTSTVGLEAALMGRAVLAIDPEPGLTNLPIADMGLALGVPRIEDLAVEMARVFEDTALRRRLETAFEGFPVDGGSSDRIIDELLALASKHHHTTEGGRALGAL